MSISTIFYIPMNFTHARISILLFVKIDLYYVITHPNPVSAVKVSASMFSPVKCFYPVNKEAIFSRATRDKQFAFEDLLQAIDRVHVRHEPPDP